MAQSASVELLTAAAATGAAQLWPGGRGLFHAGGTFGGTTVGLEYQTYGGTWVTVKAMDGAGVRTPVVMTAADGFIFELPPCPIRATITGGAGVSVSAGAARIIY